jgi:histidinol-phosphate/aromatic aminotransferase/cobyric acid decarboxylase-like protein
LAAANWLALKGAREVTVLAPRYFAVPHALARFGMTVRELPLVGEFELPMRGELARTDAVWVTHPVYNTGSRALLDQIGAFELLLEGGVRLVVDEVLAETPSVFATRLAGHPNLIAVHSPHKGICVNGLKFAALVGPAAEEVAFEHWADVLAGGLSLSALAAIRQFLSPSFDDYRTKFLAGVGAAATWLGRSVSEVAGARLLEGSFGHFRMIAFPEIPATRGTELAWRRRLLEATGVTTISGDRSGFDPALGYSFRVNLARDGRAFRAGLTRHLRALSREASGLDLDAT